MTARLSLEPVVVAGGTQEEGEDEAAGQGEERLPQVHADKGMDCPPQTGHISSVFSLWQVLDTSCPTSPQ